MIFLFSSICIGIESKGLFYKYYNDKIVNIYSSGSSKQIINGSLTLTKPEYSIYPWNKEYNWCSNCGNSMEDHPWITFSLKNKKMKIRGYYIRVGCCYTSTCCCQEFTYKYCTKCCLYSWSLQISNNNVTWTEVHKMKDDHMTRCKSSEYKLNKSYEAKYVRLIQNEACPGDPPCISINKLDLLGEVIDDGQEFLNEENNFVSYHDDDDEDVSIIGHISKNGNP